MTDIQEYFQLYPKEQALLQVGEMVFLEKNRHQAEEYASANQLEVQEVKRPANSKESKSSEKPALGAEESKKQAPKK